MMIKSSWKMINRIIIYRYKVYNPIAISQYPIISTLCSHFPYLASNFAHLLSTSFAFAVLTFSSAYTADVSFSKVSGSISMYDLITLYVMVVTVWFQCAF